MHVNVVVKGQTVGLRFEVDNAPAQAVLLGEMGGLRDLLEERGFSMDSAEVFFQGDQSQSSERDASWGAGGGSTQEEPADSSQDDVNERASLLDIEV